MIIENTEIKDEPDPQKNEDAKVSNLCHDSGYPHVYNSVVEVQVILQVGPESLPLRMQTEVEDVCVV